MTSIRRNDKITRDTRDSGGQHAAPVGTDTLHHVNPWDFSIALANAGGQYMPTIGTSTTDQTDEQREAEAVESFNAALQDAVTATFGGQAF